MTFVCVTCCARCGTQHNTTQQHNADYIVLEDLTAVYRHPCLLDIKMGVRQWGDDATPKKIEYEKFKVRVGSSALAGLCVVDAHT